MNTHDIKDCFLLHICEISVRFSLEGGTAGLKALLSLGCFVWLDRGEIGGLESFQWLYIHLILFASSVTKVGAF